MLRRGMLLLIVVHAFVVLSAGAGGFMLNSYLDDQEDQRVKQGLAALSNGVRPAVDQMLRLGHPSAAIEMLEQISATRAEVGFALETASSAEPFIVGAFKRGGSCNHEMALSIGGRSDLDSPEMATLSVSIECNRSAVLARQAAVYLVTIFPAAALAFASIRGAYARSIIERQLASQISRIRTENGNLMQGSSLPDTIEDELSQLAETVSGMAAYKEFFTNALQSMADSLMIVNKEGVILAANQASVAQLGYPEEELLGMQVSRIWADEKGMLFPNSRLRSMLTGDKTSDTELNFKRKDGSLNPVRLSGSAIRTHDHQITGYVCIATDITERRRTERERKRLNEELLDTSRRAGMAEVATGVLHNVGNVLNSVTIASATIGDIARKSRVSKLLQLAELVDQNKEELGQFFEQDEKGKRVPEYLTSLAKTLAAERQQLLNESAELSKSVDHIKKVISVQQQVARVSGVAEPVQADEMLDDAVKIRETALARYNIKLVRNIRFSKPVCTDKHKALQILVNLVANAIDAMIEAAPGDTEDLTLELTVERSKADESHVVFRVEDSGPGIPDENLTRIFNHGFTTKKTGHGFGLHSAAIAAQELGGTLVAKNRPEGRGACFELSVPIKAVESTKRIQEAA